MPRGSRLDVSGLIHHVMARGIEGREIFRDEADREVFLERLADLIGKYGGPTLYAWALMSNHFHILLRTNLTPLSSVMRRLMTSHAVRFNRKHRRKGHLFQNRYKSIVVEEEAYFLELVRYIHLNPVRAGLVQTPEELEKYPYTGHSVLSGHRKFAAQNMGSVLGRFAQRQQAAIQGYREFVIAGFSQGAREELRGGGLLRSAGSGVNLITNDPDEQILADERILGSGDFVERVLSSCATVSREAVNIDEILGTVTTRTGISREQILGPGRNRAISKARREFYFKAHEAGVAPSSLGRLSNRTHVAVMLAIEQARLELDAIAGEQLS